MYWVFVAFYVAQRASPTPTEASTAAAPRAGVATAVEPAASVTAEQTKLHQHRPHKEIKDREKYSRCRRHRRHHHQHRHCHRLHHHHCCSHHHLLKPLLLLLVLLLLSTILPPPLPLLPLPRPLQSRPSLYRPNCTSSQAREPQGSQRLNRVGIQGRQKDRHHQFGGGSSGVRARGTLEPQTGRCPRWRGVRSGQAKDPGAAQLKHGGGWSYSARPCTRYRGAIWSWKTITCLLPVPTCNSKCWRLAHMCFQTNTTSAHSYQRLSFALLLN